PEGEASIVAEVAQVAEMVGDALALETNRTQHRRARWHGQIGNRFGGLGVRPRIGDGAVAGNAPGEPVRFRERKCLEALLDPLVNVREPLFETQHLFTHDLEPKVSRLDDAGVNRTDCDLVDAIAAHADKRVILFTRLPFGRWLEVAPQGKHVDRPCRLPYPRP